jgi:hypothetical protein
MDDHQLWLRSSLFEIEAGEDQQTNPGRYGKQLSTWLRSKLIERGYKAAEVLPEDWGWCVMCRREPFLLWIGCGSVFDDSQYPNSPPPGREVTWSCFVTAEKPFLRGLFKRIDTSAAVEALFKDVEAILAAEPSISLTEEP